MTDPVTPYVTLSDGTHMPAVGLGTFGSDKYGPEEIAEAVYGAVKAGYRLIDCAEVYGNEDKIGEALGRLFREGAVRREELFVVSKVWNDHHGCVGEACENSLAALGLDYLDAYYIHWPFPNYHAPGCDGESRNPDSKPFSADEFLSTYRQCETMYDEGKIRAIGVSNMTVSKLEAVFPSLRVRPTLIEMELHPAFRQKDLRAWCADHGLQPVGFCPLGSPSRPERDKTSEDIAAMEMPVVKEIAARHGIHPAAVCLKWSRQSGAVPIPFSVKPAQYRMNLACLTEDPLTDEELAAIDASDADCRLIKGQVFLWEGADDWHELWT